MPTLQQMVRIEIKWSANALDALPSPPWMDMHIVSSMNIAAIGRIRDSSCRLSVGLFGFGQRIDKSV